MRISTRIRNFAFMWMSAWWKSWKSVVRRDMTIINECWPWRLIHKLRPGLIKVLSKWMGHKCLRCDHNGQGLLRCKLFTVSLVYSVHTRWQFFRRSRFLLSFFSAIALLFGRCCLAFRCWVCGGFGRPFGGLCFGDRCCFGGGFVDFFFAGGGGRQTLSGGGRTLRLRLTKSTEWWYCNTSTIKYNTH